MKKITIKQKRDQLIEELVYNFFESYEIELDKEDIQTWNKKEAFPITNIKSSFYNKVKDFIGLEEEALEENGEEYFKNWKEALVNRIQQILDNYVSNNLFRYYEDKFNEFNYILSKEAFADLKGVEK